MKQPINYVVGMTVYVRAWRSAGVEPLTVVSVGRKWATLSDGKRALLGGRTLECDLQGVEADVYTSPEGYTEALALKEAWRSFQERVRSHYQPPEGATVEILAEYQRVLGLK